MGENVLMHSGVPSGLALVKSCRRLRPERINRHGYAAALYRRPTYFIFIFTIALIALTGTRVSRKPVMSRITT